ELRPEPDEVGQVALVDVRVVGDVPLRLDHVLGDLAADAGELDPRAGDAEVELRGVGLARLLRPGGAVGGAGGEERREVVEEDAAVGAGPADPGEVDAELAGEQ